jgi:hypothetical protein
MNKHDDSSPEPMSARTKSAIKRKLRRQTLYKATGFFFIMYVTGLLNYAAMQPDRFRIERSVRMHAPAEKIFSLINDFHQWEAWSPWEKVDPELKRTYSGTRSGSGAVYAWQGNHDVGVGRMEIIQAIPAASVVIKIDFMQPFEAHNTIEFTLNSQDNTTTVTQAMYGTNTYFSKLLGLMFDVDKMVGDKYEKGLSRLKIIAEQ